MRLTAYFGLKSILKHFYGVGRAKADLNETLLLIINDKDSIYNQNIIYSHRSVSF